nr:trypsin-2-like isoform X2 [Penaeus vannamei]
MNSIPPIAVPAEGPPLPSHAMVKGSEAEPYKRGYQAFISGGIEVCGAVVISETFVLTAAHCIRTESNARMTVATGIHDLKVQESFTQVIPVAKALIHPDYNPREGHIRGDIALVRLEQAIVMNDKVFPIKLPTRDVDVDMPVVVTGWVNTVLENKPVTALQEIVTHTISLRQCKSAFPWVDKSIFCTTATNWGTGPCDGDSGGPAMHEGYLVGLVSFATAACETTYPQGFTNVYFYLKWINENMLSDYMSLPY